MSSPPETSFLNLLAAKILKNLPTLPLNSQQEIKLISPEKTWCLKQLNIQESPSLQNLQAQCRATPTPSCLFYLNEKNLEPRQLEKILPNIPLTLIIPCPQKTLTHV